MMTRRTASGLLAGTAALRGSAATPWIPEWDREVIRAAVEQGRRAFDPQESMIRSHIGPGYHYHTALKDMTVHPTRESLDFALLLLETGEDSSRDQAVRILERVIPLQDTDPASQWYGLWGWYLEEPQNKMAPADWNWADFNGSLLLLILHRHGPRLSEALRQRVRETIRHAAYSVRRRNVTMAYTNIAIKGTFVVTSAAELLDDGELAGYARDRQRRLAEEIDVTGSFAEYSSPTYAWVSLANLTRFRMFVRDSGARARMEKIHDRLWEHIARHWHAPTAQLAGPMSRAYSTDIGRPLWLQKALDGRLAFVTLEELRRAEGRAYGEVGYLDVRCPAALHGHFLELPKPRQQREWFLAPRGPARGVQGTTYLAPRFCLGSINHADFWVQRRPLLAYWGDRSRPARFLQVRFLKDNYDFVSAILYSAQQDNCVLGAVNFRSNGGDRHGNLDPIRDGRFEARELFLQFLIQGPSADPPLLVDGRPHPWSEEPIGLAGPRRLSLNLGDVFVSIQLVQGAFTGATPSLRLRRNGLESRLDVILFQSTQPSVIEWARIDRACAVFTLAMDAANGSLRGFDRRLRPARLDESAGAALCHWPSPAGGLELAFSTGVRPIAAQDAAFAEKLDGREIPYVRLSDHPVA